MKRIASIDVARGAVMVIMALDHSRDLLHISAAQSPTNLATTTPILFFTRWITHLCAPAFVFLSGTSAFLYLFGKTAPTTAPLSPDLRSRRRFLLTRGLVLVLMEFTIVNFGLFFDIRFHLFMFEVIATIGTGMVLLSFLARLPLKLILAIALAIIFGHDLFSPVMLPATGPLRFTGTLLFSLNVFNLGPDRLFLVAYPILPWLGIMLAGFAAGRLFTLSVEERKATFLRLGMASLALFVLLRLINRYGDPLHWTTQKNALFTFLSFINVNKYPPSLLFTLVTLGILLLVLSVAEGRDNRTTRFLLIYGQVPMFYFIVHFYILHLLLIITVLLQGYPWSELPFAGGQFGRPPGAGLPLAAVYAIWITVVLVLYPICLRYGRYKQAHREKEWLRYL
jgi:uncharacterized membrane protein